MQPMIKGTQVMQTLLIISRREAVRMKSLHLFLENVGKYYIVDTVIMDARLPLDQHNKLLQPNILCFIDTQYMAMFQTNPGQEGSS